MADVYLTDINRTDLERSLGSLRNLSQRHRDFWNNWGGQIGTLVSYSWSTFIGSTGPGNLVLERTRADTTAAPQADFQVVGELAKRAGVSSIYILVDKVDEIEQTQNNFNAAYQLVAPLLNKLSIVETSPYAFKFFLPDNLRPLWLEAGGRSDRIHTHDTSWNEEELIRMTNKRLETFFEGVDPPKIEFISGSQDWTDVILDFAQCSPRDLYRILSQCEIEQSRIKQGSTEISDTAREKAIDSFSRQRVFEMVGLQQQLDRLRKIHLLDFSVESAARHLEIQPNSVRRHIRALENSGIVHRIPERETVKALGAPTISYAVDDIRLARQIFPDISLRRFLETKTRRFDSGLGLMG